MIYMQINILLILYNLNDIRKDVLLVSMSNKIIQSQQLYIIDSDGYSYINEQRQ